MEYVLILKALGSLCIVLFIMFVFLKIIQKSTKFGFKKDRTEAMNNCKISNILYIDENTKIVTVINDVIGKNYLIAVGKNNIVLLDKNTCNKEEAHDKFL